MNSYSLFNPEWLRGDYALQTVAYYQKTMQDYAMNEQHHHKHVEIMYVLKGHCTVEINHDKCQLQKGQLIMLDALVSHRLLVDKDTSCRMLNIEFRMVAVKDKALTLGQMVASQGIILELIKESFEYGVITDTEEVFHTMRQLIRAYDRENQCIDLYQQSLYFQLLVSLARLWVEQRDAKIEPTKHHVKLAIDYIHQAMDQEIRCKDIGKALGLHENYLQRIFKQVTDQTITEYISALRMEKAKMLLINTDLPITEIGEYCGMNSRQYFSKLFKGYYGQSPQAFRKNAIHIKWEI